MPPSPGHLTLLSSTRLEAAELLNGRLPAGGAVMADPRRRPIKAKDVVIAGHAMKIVRRVHRIGLAGQVPPGGGAEAPAQLTQRPERHAAAELLLRGCDPDDASCLAGARLLSRAGPHCRTASTQLPIGTQLVGQPAVAQRSVTPYRGAAESN
jgi:hypothetical protein